MQNIAIGLNVIPIKLSHFSYTLFSKRYNILRSSQIPVETMHVQCIFYGFFSGGAKLPKVPNCNLCYGSKVTATFITIKLENTCMQKPSPC
jgi:hypothetical protein